MGWFEVIVVMIVVSHLDTIQSEMNQADYDITTTLTDMEPNCLIEIDGCRNAKNVTVIKIIGYKLDLTDVIKKINTSCCDITKIGDSFHANLSCITSSCQYELSLPDLELTHYLDVLFFDQFETECPNMKGICMKPTRECPLKSFSVTPFLAKSRTENIFYEFVSFNITWNGSDSNEKIEISIIQDTNYNNSSLCMYNEHDFNFYLMDGNAILPIQESPPSIEAEPGCGYIFSLEWLNYRCKLSYAVPECVEKKCDCSKYKPTSSIRSIKPIGKDTFLIEWDPGTTTPNNSSYIIENVSFYYKTSSDEVMFKSARVRNNFENHASNVHMKLFEGEKSIIQGEFTNNYSCVEYITISFTAPTLQNTATNNTAIVLVVVLIFFVLIIIVKYRFIKKIFNKLLGNVLCGHTRSQHLSPELTRLEHIQIPMSTNIQYTPMEISECDYEFPKDKIVLIKVLDIGAFGIVYSAKAEGIGGIKGSRLVAVKTAGDGKNISKEDSDDFLAEIELFKKIGYHENIVQLLGCCTLDAPLMMIMELVPCGSLKKYLENLRKLWAENQKHANQNKQVFFPPDDSDGAYIEPRTPHSPDSITSSRLPSTSDTISTTLDEPLTPLLTPNTQPLSCVLDHTELQNFALQIAKGMSHLEQLQITHRDLAARNILINEKKVLKISDFGLSRKGPYVNHRRKKLPLRWMAIEAITDHKYDNKSDVWSFGVVLWEIGTLGAFPYYDIMDSYIQQYLEMGERLKRPEICTDELYHLMTQCWAANPNDRPTFRELSDALDFKKRKAYVNFSQLNPTYMFPPSDIK